VQQRREHSSPAFLTGEAQNPAPPVKIPRPGLRRLLLDAYDDANNQAVQ
jgi:hypothetical protein